MKPNIPKFLDYIIGKIDQASENGFEFDTIYINPKMYSYTEKHLKEISSYNFSMVDDVECMTIFGKTLKADFWLGDNIVVFVNSENLNKEWGISAPVLDRVSDGNCYSFKGLAIHR